MPIWLNRAISKQTDRVKLNKSKDITIKMTHDEIKLILAALHSYSMSWQLDDVAFYEDLDLLHSKFIKLI